MKNKFIDTAIHAVESSGQLLVEYFEKIHDYKQKNSNTRDLVTEVDLLAEKNAKNVIESFFPNHRIHGEELGSDNKNSEYCWFIDPIDGTVNYSQGIPICAVSVGLKYKDQIIAGSIFNPFSNELYFASKGEGAFLNGKKITTSKKTSFSEGLYVVAFSSEINSLKNKEYEIFGNINNSTRGVLRLGSAALALAFLSSGRIDGFWGKNLKIWDIAAGIIIAKESGCKILYESFEDDNIKENSFIIASNYELFDNLKKRII